MTKELPVLCNIICSYYQCLSIDTICIKHPSTSSEITSSKYCILMLSSIYVSLMFNFHILCFPLIFIWRLCLKVPFSHNIRNCTQQSSHMAPVLMSPHSNTTGQRKHSFSILPTFDPDSHKCDVAKTKLLYSRAHVFAPQFT